MASALKFSNPGLSSPVTQELLTLAFDLTGPVFQGIHCIPVQQQKIFRTFATSLVYGQNLMNVTYVSQMCSYLLDCLKGRIMTPFPTTWTSFTEQNSHE